MRYFRELLNIVPEEYHQEIADWHTKWIEECWMQAVVNRRGQPEHIAIQKECEAHRMKRAVSDLVVRQRKVRWEPGVCLPNCDVAVLRVMVVREEPPL